MQRDEVEIIESLMQRWFIIKKSDPQLAWSGSEWVPHKDGIPTGDAQICNFDSYKEAEKYVMENERAEIRRRLDEMGRRLSGEIIPMTKAEIEKKIDEAKAWIAIMEESQATRQKYGKQFETDFKLELGSDAASARLIISDLEKEVYGGILAAMRKRLENVERAFEEGKPKAEGAKQ